MRVQLLFTIASLWLASVAAIAQDAYIDPNYTEAVAKAKLFVDSLRNAQNIPSLSIAVGVKGKTIWKEALGLADVKSNLMATTKTKYRVGSISKPMTAFALAVLYEEAKLDFDDKISDYVETFQNKEYEPTIREVAGHQGGVRHYQGFEFLSNKQYNSVEESMSIFENDKLLFEPGSDYKYSTYGYVLLSRVIEKASGMEYLDFMNERIFMPLEMENTIAENAGKSELNKATFYAKKGKREAGSVNLSSKWAGGGFLSTPADLVNMVNRATKIISAQTLFTLVKPQALNNGKMTDYGMGWRHTVTQNDQRVLVHHGGASSGARSFLLMLLNEQIVVAISTNSEADYGLQEAYDISKFFLK